MIFAPVLGALILLGCNGQPKEKDSPQDDYKMEFNDVHTFAKPAEAAITHLDLDIKVDFEHKQITGTATYDLENKTGTNKIYFDTRDLNIKRVGTDKNFSGELTWKLGDEVEFLGRPLEVDITPETKVVAIEFATNPGAEALQWLNPVQTAGKVHPFLFTQSQAILARTWIPIQDGPGIRFTYNATVQVPKELLAVMSAENPREKNDTGIYTFKMDQPIPAYLMALSVGDLAFQSVGEHTGVYAEPSMLERSVYEFGEMEDMLVAAENLYGKYRWDQYDLIVLPPSFPFGGMENPRLTFATPTILAGDRSLTSLVAHELAHSWSGNLVTNATWDDFWLNEGFTVYFERRIMEAISGRSYSEMLALLGYQDLQETVADLGADNPDTDLKLALTGRNPDDGMTDIAYEKGYCLLRLMEETAGREKFDAFLKDYFNSNAFKVMTTEAFIKHVENTLFKDVPGMAEKIRINDWVYSPGIPDNVSVPVSDRFTKVDEALAAWQNGTAAKDLATTEWTTHEWLHFIRHLPAELTSAQLAQLDAAFGFTQSGNKEILAAWFMHTIRHQYKPADDALEAFLVSVGRRKFLKPLYKQLLDHGQKARALEIYTKARPNYHSVSTNTMDEMLEWKQG